MSDSRTVKPGEPVTYHQMAPERREALDQGIAFKSLSQLPHPPNHTDDSKAKKLLKREADNLDAEVTWDLSRTHISIYVLAKPGHVWASCKERILTHFVERSDPRCIHEAVSEVIQAMSDGYLKAAHASHDEDCECDSCEELDSEVDELDF